MFFDLLLMFIECLFMWFEKKFKKRIKRIFLTILIILLKQNNVDRVIQLFLEFKNLIETFNKCSNIQSRYDIITNDDIINNFFKITDTDLFSNSIPNFNRNKINPFIDYILKIYYDNIINLLYLIDDTKIIDPSTKAYCEQNYKLAKLLDTNYKIEDVTAINNIKKFTILKSEICQYLIDIVSMEKDMIETIEFILELLDEIKTNTNENMIFNTLPINLNDLF
jgi:hypothetical protein